MRRSPFASREGGALIVVSVSDGNQSAEYRFESPPVWDGMAAADSRLYLAAVDGKVLCFRRAE